MEVKRAMESSKKSETDEKSVEDLIVGDLFAADLAWKNNMKQKLMDALKKAPAPIQEHVKQLEDKMQVTERVKMILQCQNKDLQEENTELKKEIAAMRKSLYDLETGRGFKVKKGLSKTFANEEQLQEINEKVKKRKDIDRNQRTKFPSVQKQLEQLNLEGKRVEENASPSKASGCANKIVLKGVNRQILSCNLKQVMVDIGRKISIHISRDDIVAVEQMKQEYFIRQRLTPNTVVLVVEFTRHAVKLQFLKKKELLKKDNVTKSMEMADYVSESTYDLYQYAKSLKIYGYAAVYWRNDEVFVKRTLSHQAKEICIRSKKDVDDLHREAVDNDEDEDEDDDDDDEEDDDEEDTLGTVHG